MLTRDIAARSQGRLQAGWSLVELLVAVSIVAVFLSLTLGAVQRVRATAARARCADRLRQLALAQHSYHDAKGHLPSGMTWQSGQAPEPYLSWLARSLPYLGEQSLWNEIETAYQQNKNFLTPVHTARGSPVQLFLCPSDVRVDVSRSKDVAKNDVAYTSFLGVAGRDTGVCDGLYYRDSKHTLGDVRDGTSSTLLFGERPPSANLSLGWWYAGWGQRHNGDAEFLLGVRSRCYDAYASVCPQGPYHYVAGKIDNQCDAYHFWSFHTGGANFAFADGSVRFLSYSVDHILPALASRAGGEVAAVPD